MIALSFCEINDTIFKKEKNIMLEIGSKAPDFLLLDQDGKEVSLSQFKGKR